QRGRPPGCETASQQADALTARHRADGHRTSKGKTRNCSWLWRFSWPVTPLSRSPARIASVEIPSGIAELGFGRSLTLAITLTMRRPRGNIGCSTKAKAAPLLQKQPQTRPSVIFEPLFHASDAMT